MTPYYSESGVVIYHGDCREVLASVGHFDHVVTDPPYRIDGKRLEYACPGGVGLRRIATETVGVPWGYSLEWVDAINQRDPANWVVFCNGAMLGDICSRIPPSTVFVWRKSNAPRMARPVPRLDCEFIVWQKRRGDCGTMKLFTSQVIDAPMPQAGCFATERILEPGTGKSAHPCQKPLAVVQPFVARLPDGVVLDPFIGTGTTLVAAKACGRQVIGIEQDESYCEIAANRLRQGVLWPAQEAV